VSNKFVIIHESLKIDTSISHPKRWTSSQDHVLSSLILLTHSYHIYVPFLFLHFQNPTNQRDIKKVLLDFLFLKFTLVTHTQKSREMHYSWKQHSVPACGSHLRQGCSIRIFLLKIICDKRSNAYHDSVRLELDVYGLNPCKEFRATFQHFRRCTSTVHFLNKNMH
jgi:hypothetical protein